MGHLFKQVILLAALKKNLGKTKTFFFIKKDAQGMRWLRRKGIRYTAMPAGLSKSAEPAWMKRRLPRGARGVFVVDVLDTGKTYLRALKAGGCRVVTMENRSAGRFEADAVVNAIVEGPQKGGRLRIFAPEYARARKTALKGRPRVLISLGGGDDRGLTGYAAARIREAVPAARITAVEGPAQRLQKGPMRVVKAPSSLARLLAASDCALLAGGGTLYEAALLGVPAVAVAKRSHQRRNIAHFAKAGAAVGGGTLDRAGLGSAAVKVAGILKDRARAGRMARAGKRLVDGKGAFRVAALVIGQLRKVKGEGR